MDLLRWMESHGVLYAKSFLEAFYQTKNDNSGDGSLTECELAMPKQIKNAIPGWSGARMAIFLLITTFLPATAEAKITAQRCSFETLKDVYFTFYSDGAPTRVGTSIGIGNRATTIVDKLSGAVVIIEVNTDNIPVTLTTISPDMNAIHSRHLLAWDGSTIAPSQGRGNCMPVPVE